MHPKRVIHTTVKVIKSLCAIPPHSERAWSPVAIPATKSMPDPVLAIGALKAATSAIDKLVAASRDDVNVQRKLSLYPGLLAAFKNKARAVKQLLEETPPGPRGSALHIARSALSTAVDEGLVHSLCPLCTYGGIT